MNFHVISWSILKYGKNTVDWIQLLLFDYISYMIFPRCVSYFALFIPNTPISPSNLFSFSTLVCARLYCNLPLPVCPAFGIDQDMRHGTMNTGSNFAIQLRLFITPFHSINQCRDIMRCCKLGERHGLILSTYLTPVRGCLHYNVDCLIFWICANPGRCRPKSDRTYNLTRTILRVILILI